jgi:hypothetical protein
VSMKVGSAVGAIYAYPLTTTIPSLPIIYFIEFESLLKSYKPLK